MKHLGLVGFYSMSYIENLARMSDFKNGTLDQSKHAGSIRMSSLSQFSVWTSTNPSKSVGSSSVAWTFSVLAYLHPLNEMI